MSAVCDECKGALITDNLGGLVCTDCGLVHELPPPVPFRTPGLSKQRLGSIISRKSSAFTDHGKRSLSASNQLKFNRLKELQDSVYRGSCLDLFRLNTDLEFVVNYLLLPEEVIDKTMKLFQDVVSKVRNPYNNYALLMAICLMVVSRELGERAPVKLSEVVEAFGLRGHQLSTRVLAKTLSYASNIISFNKKFRSSEEFVSRVVCKLKESPYIVVRIRAAKMDPDEYFTELGLYSKDLLSSIPPPRRSGKNPFLLAASAVFASGTIIAKRHDVPNIFTKTQFSKDVGIAEYTLRSHLTSVFGEQKEVGAPLIPAPL
jgi:transcription initiation factor TFIIIB Brf1 subunit/transcription initiation factor TFIIB